MPSSAHRICPQCGFNSPSTVECARCGIVFEKFKFSPVKRSSELISEELAKRDRSNNEVFTDIKVTVWAFPIAIMISYIVRQFWPLRTVAYFTSVIPLHELGHSMIAWLGGRFAFPSGMFVPSAGVSFIAYERSLPITIAFLGTVFFLAYRAWIEKLWYFLGLCLLVVISSIYLTGGIDEILLSVFISYGGIAGEFIIGTVLILAFFNPLFSRLRWDFFRYPFLLMGTNAYVNAMLTWHHIQSRTESIPFGTAISSDGAKDAGGDMNRLLAAGWSEADIISRYLQLGKICLIIITIQYLVAIYRSRSKDLK